MIEEIEELKPQLQIPPLRDVGVLVRGEISFRETRLPELLNLLVAISAQGGCRELAGGEYTILTGRGCEYAREVSTSRCRLVIAADVWIVKIVAVSVIVAACTKWCRGDNRKGIAGLVNGSTAKPPASAQKSGGATATV